LIAAALSDESFLADVAAAGSSAGELHVWWLGQSGFLLAHAGRHALLDPYLSDSLTRKYRGSGTPHVRLSARVVEPRALDFVDAVAASHHHTDHLDGETLSAVLRASPAAVLLAPAAHQELAAERAGVGVERVVAMDDGVSAEIAGFRFEAVPAAHERIERDAAGRMLCLGYVISCGGFRVYHAGDTVPYDGMAERIGAVDLALLPINGRDPERGVAGNLDGIEAARLAAAIDAGAAVPCHFDMFEFNTARPGDFADACAELGVRSVILRGGERLSLEASS
jgi:L-ascorbate metabolism protein UlaG (beta-lactamase superfamily)